MAMERSRARSWLVGLLAVAAVTVTGCGGNLATAPSGGPTRAGSDAAPTPPADIAPVELAGGDAYAWRMAVAPDGTRALVGQSSGFFATSRKSRIDAVRRQPDGSWGEPERVSFSNGSGADLDPFFTADGARLWFSSIRPVDGEGRKDTDLWYVDHRPDGTFGEPVNPGAAINSPAEDLYPTVAADGTLYFGSDRAGDGFDIWYVAPLPAGGWSTPAPLPGPVNTDGWEFNPALAPDGRTLVFTALDRSGGPGLGDLWFTTPVEDRWSEPALLTTVNSARDEYHASFSPDGATLFFVRDGTLHHIATEATGLPVLP